MMLVARTTRKKMSRKFVEGEKSYEMEKQVHKLKGVVIYKVNV